MPSLMRFVTVLVMLCAAGFASVFALATMVSPHTREMTVTISPQRLKAQPASAAASNPQTAGAEQGGGAQTTR